MQLIKKIFILSAIVIMIGCGKEKMPSRDHFPNIKAQLFNLQEAVKMKSRASIDSLLSVKMLDLGLSSDSLLNYVYFVPGSYESFNFVQFGSAEIVYTDKKARIDCFIMDSTHIKNRPLNFTLIYDKGAWLFKKFEPGEMIQSDTLNDNNSDTL